MKTCLALHTSLRRKYGKTIEDILLYRDKIADELESLLSRDERLVAAQEKLDHLQQDLQIEAGELSISQKKWPSMEQSIMEQLQQLHMEKATFKVSVQQKAAGNFDANGYDEYLSNFNKCR